MNVLITGVAGGMGLATAKGFINKGYEVYGLDIKKPEELEHFHFFEVDLTSESSINKVFKTISKENVTFDSIIHLSGLYDLNSLIEISEEDFIRIFDVNLFSVYRINKTFLPLLNKKGKIIITTSELATLDPLPFTGIYAITKAALDKYAYSLRMELQLLDYQVVVVRPGAVSTKMLDTSLSKINKFKESTTHYKASAKAFDDVVNKVESRKIPPLKIAKLMYKIVNKKNPRYVYEINRNPGLVLLNVLPKRMQNKIIKDILKRK